MGFFSKLFGQKSAERKLSKREFTEQLAQEIQQSIPDILVKVMDADNDDEISIHIEHPNSQSNIVYPDNLYASYLQEREDFAAYKQNIIYNIHDMYFGEEESPTLIPNIKHIDWVKEIEKVSSQSTSDEPAKLVTFPFAGDLVIVIAMDYTSKMTYLFESDLPNYTPDGNKDTALQLARDNLRAHSEHVEIEPIQNTWQLIRFDQTYDASWVLLFEEIAPKLNLVGEPVLALISRDRFIVADSNVPEDVVALKQFATEQISQVPHALSAHLYHYQNGHIRLYEALQ